ncbi:MAG: hypothetical protein Q8Q30_03650 [Candidatus Woesebacteria bacterium]|nr:hypothetical protein [Candidatus Woesebacteria bacterium]
MNLENLDGVNIRETFNHAVPTYMQVRDTPFALGADGGDLNALITEGVGGCTRKHLFLADRLKRSGFKVDLGIATFDWRELPIPSEILSLLKDPIQYHMFLYVRDTRIDASEMQLDATWDRRIKHLGFIVSDWDGFNSTPLAVPIKTLWRQNYAILKARSIASSMIRQVLDVTKGNQPTPFNNRFNMWLNKERSE